MVARVAFGGLAFVVLESRSPHAYSCFVVADFYAAAPDPEPLLSAHGADGFLLLVDDLGVVHDFNLPKLLKLAQLNRS